MYNELIKTKPIYLSVASGEAGKNYLVVSLSDLSQRQKMTALKFYAVGYLRKK